MEDIKLERIYRSRRRTLALVITDEARLVVRAPLALPESVIRDFIRRKSAWIQKKQNELRQGVKRFIPRHMVALYKRQAMEKLSGRCLFYSGVTGLRYSSVKVTNAARRWGSCGPSGSLNFSWRLALAPPEVVDYVVVHEIMHLSQRNHSQRFWDKVRQVFPDYKECERWLKENSRLLVVSLALFFLCGCKPTPLPPSGELLADDLILSPAEGKIVTIASIEEGQIPVINDAGKKVALTELEGELKGRYQLVLIFMGPHNYHGVSSPVAGTISKVTHTSGKFRNNYQRFAYLENERTVIVIDGHMRVVVIPIAGFLYRRVVCDVKPGDNVPKGGSLGRIVLGSAVALALPEKCQIMVKPQDNVKIGETVIARMEGKI